MIPKWVDRKTWLATPSESGIISLKTPVPYVVIHHTETTSCRILADCKAQVLDIQQFDIFSQDLKDIRYNFLIGGDGYIYEGRGWTKEGLHTRGYNDVSIGIAFIGYFENRLPTIEMLLAAKEVIKEGVEGRYIKRDYQLLGARQLINTTSPGRKLYDLIKSWPHWSATV
ncbi:putative animal peptidoglycan recognition proteins homologous to Bacteriophage T3 lysozyme [Trypoxylus dichotomus]